jgi:hypothetical protein
MTTRAAGVGEWRVLIIFVAKIAGYRVKPKEQAIANQSYKGKTRYESTV